MTPTKASPRGGAYEHDREASMPVEARVLGSGVLLMLTGEYCLPEIKNEVEKCYASTRFQAVRGTSRLLVDARDSAMEPSDSDLRYAAEEEFPKLFQNFGEVALLVSDAFQWGFAVEVQRVFDDTRFCRIFRDVPEALRWLVS